MQQKLWGYKKIAQKTAFTLIEMSVVVVIIAVMLSTIIVSKTLIISVKINKIQQDYRDVNALLNLFQNTFDCLPGDCNINNLTTTIINATPSACFNLQTTTGMGNANSPGNTSETTTASQSLMVATGSGAISSPADRTCAFYQMQAFEIIGRTASIKRLFEINNANAIGRRKLDLSVNNPIIAARLASSLSGNNSQLAILNADTSTNGSIAQTQAIIATNNAQLATLNADTSTNGSIAQTQAIIATNNAQLATLNANESTNGSIAQTQAIVTTATNTLAALNSTATPGTVVNGIVISAANNASLAQAAATNASAALNSCNSYLNNAVTTTLTTPSSSTFWWYSGGTADPNIVAWGSDYPSTGQTYVVTVPTAGSYRFNYACAYTYGSNVSYTIKINNGGSVSLPGCSWGVSSPGLNLSTTITLNAGTNIIYSSPYVYNCCANAYGYYGFKVTNTANTVTYSSSNPATINQGGTGLVNGCSSGSGSYCASACAKVTDGKPFLSNGPAAINVLNGSPDTVGSIANLKSTLANLECQKNGTTTVAGANCTGVTNLGGTADVSGSVAALSNTLSTLQAQATNLNASNINLGVTLTNLQAKAINLNASNVSLGVTLTNLQAQATALNDANDALTNPNNFVSLSIPTATNPQVPSLETQAMWDLRTVGSMASPGFYPFELNDTANFSSWKNKHILIARNSINTNDLIDTSATNTMAALPAFMAKKIDIKYDDGMPYTGNIISGQNISKMGSGTGCTTSTTISTATPTATSTTNYIASGTSDLTNGCVVAWKLDVV